MKITDVIIRPLITEKATQLTQNSVYVFEVKRNADKHKIANALEKLFKVKVGAVRTMLYKGKIKRVGKKMISKKQPDRKIAHVFLKEGTIDLFPQS